MADFRIIKNRNYITIANYHFKEKEMSLKAKGLLSLMLSLPSNWDYSIAGLVTLSKDNETSVKTALKELKDFGYVKVTKLLPNETKTGRIEYLYDVYEESYKKQEGKKQGLEILPLENQCQYNNIINNTKYTSNTKDIINTKVNNNKIIKENTISKDIVKRKVKFVPPTLEEVQSYIKEKNYSVDPKVFFDYFNESNWVDANGNKVKNWKQKVITWNSRNQSRNKNNYKPEKTFEDIYEPFRE